MDYVRTILSIVLSLIMIAIGTVVVCLGCSLLYFVMIKDHDFVSLLVAIHTIVWGVFFVLIPTETLWNMRFDFNLREII